MQRSKKEIEEYTTKHSALKKQRLTFNKQKSPFRENEAGVGASLEGQLYQYSFLSVLHGYIKYILH